MAKIKLGKFEPMLAWGDLHLHVLYTCACYHCLNVEETNLITTTNKDSWKLKDHPGSRLLDQTCHNGWPRSTGPTLRFQGQASSTLRVPNAEEIAGCLSRHRRPYISRIRARIVRCPSPIESEMVDQFFIGCQLHVRFKPY